MSQYNELKAAVENAVIWDNGENQITGNIMLSVLLTIINSLGAEYQFVDVATPATNPGTPDQQVFYLAVEKGVYSNFGGVELDGSQVGVFVYDSAWHLRSLGGFQRSLGSLPACDLNTLVTNGL